MLSLINYEVVAKIGEGGMGIVYKARDRRLGRYVAIKTLPHMEESSSKRRFALEARAAAGLNHPNIVVVHDIARENGQDFIVKEFVDGVQLGELLHAGALPLDRVLPIARQIADALCASHTGGIVHRDLKPTNILIGRNDVVKIVDFGLAKLLDPGRLDDPEAFTLYPVMGTAAYMAPEQARREPADERSDIFSIGVILYEMIAGRPPFAGATVTAAIESVKNDDPDPLRGVPTPVSRLILRCLAKDPARRYQHMSDVYAALDEASAGEARESRWRRKVAVLLANSPRR